jgi:AraC-like DNA-binding protein
MKISSPKELDILAKDEYFFHENSRINKGQKVWVKRIAREHWGPKFFIKRFTVDKAFIAFVQKGSVRFKDSSGNMKIARSGSVLYLAPNERILLETPDPKGVHLLVALVGSVEVINLVHKYLDKTTREITLNDSGRVEALFYRILETAEKGGMYSAEIASSLILPLLLTIHQEIKLEKNRRNQTFSVFNRCRLYIENNWNKIKSIAEVPSIFSISQPHMNKLFDKYEGCTPHQFLLKCKMSYALFELQQNDKKIIDLAFELGFSDAYSFSKSFKRILGKAPSKMKL